LFSLAVAAKDWNAHPSKIFRAVNTTLGATSIGYGVYGLITANRRSREAKAMKMSLLPAREFASFVSLTGGSLRATWRF
jgi:hypothetical protein